MSATGLKRLLQGMCQLRDTAYGLCPGQTGTSACWVCCEVQRPAANDGRLVCLGPHPEPAKGVICLEHCAGLGANAAE